MLESRSATSRSLCSWTRTDGPSRRPGLYNETRGKLETIEYLVNCAQEVFSPAKDILSSPMLRAIQQRLARSIWRPNGYVSSRRGNLVPQGHLYSGTDIFWEGGP